MIFSWWKYLFRVHFVSPCMSIISTFEYECPSPSPPGLLLYLFIHNIRQHARLTQYWTNNKLKDCLQYVLVLNNLHCILSCYFMLQAVKTFVFFELLKDMTFHLSTQTSTLVPSAYVTIHHKPPRNVGINFMNKISFNIKTKQKVF